jgi:hypothetical protein
VTVSSRALFALAAAISTLTGCDAILGGLTDRKADAGEDAGGGAFDATTTDTGRPPREAGPPITDAVAYDAGDAALGFVRSAAAFGTGVIETEATDTRGATLLVAAACSCCGPNAPATPKDSKNNAWVRLHPDYYADASGLKTPIQMFYVENPTTDRNQSFSLEPEDGGMVYNSLAVLAFSGTATRTDASDTILGVAIPLTLTQTAQPGALNPLPDEIAVTFVCGGTVAREAGIDDGFILARYQHGAASKGLDIGAAYRLAPDAEVNPTWSLPGDVALESMIGLFHGAR